MSLIELSKRINIDNNKEVIKIKCAQDIYDNFKYLFNNQKQELFYCIYLNNKNIHLDKKILHK